MPLDYHNLDSETRQRMVSEIQRDAASGVLYISPRLTESGAQGWSNLLQEAAQFHDDAWLAAQLRSRGWIRTEETRRKPKGGTTVAKVPATAPDTLAEGEFNRFYARGLCLRLVEEGVQEVEVYRAKQVENPRSESEAMLGHRISAQALLDDLRTSQGVEPALGLPPGPNSGLSIRYLR